MTIPAFAAERVRCVLAIDRYLLQAPALSSKLQLIDGTDRWTDRLQRDRHPTVFTDLASHTMRYSACVHFL